MPSIARFFGIIVYMYTEYKGGHRLPHFHAKYSEHWATFSINPPILLAGSLPRKELRYILAWAEMHVEELEENWRLVQDARRPNQIAGL